MRRIWILLGPIAFAATLPAHAQLAPPLPSLPIPRGDLPGIDRLRQDVDAMAADAAGRLEAMRRAALNQLVRDHPDRIVIDPQGFPARAGEIVIDDPDDRVVTAALGKGYRLIERSDVLGIGFVRLAVPDGRSLARAIRELRKLGARDVTSDPLHVQSGRTEGRPAPIAPGTGPLVGVIDGGVAGAALSAGFASGAPRANDHGTAVASLIAGAGTIRGGLPGARIASADVYGSDPAGGNATAIAKAIGWMVRNRVSVVTISLAGPANPLLARVIAAARARGTQLVAAVGNNGAAAPPAYPASYPGVIAVTGIDARGRVLIEAGRAAHLDYAAPGADMIAMAASGRPMPVRGTSFAAPLAAAVIARAYPVPDASALSAALGRVDAQARRGDRRYGRGVLCESCRTPPK